MSSDEELLWEVRISMPEIEHSDFIRERRAKLQSALLEAKNDQESGRGAKPLIQRVPAYLIDIKEDFKKYFEPRWVAIGPFHHRNPKFEQESTPSLNWQLSSQKRMKLLMQFYSTRLRKR